jgi:PAS domain S-box-containing protein
VAIGALGTLFLYYRDAESDFRSDLADELTTVARFKTADLENFRRDRLNAAEALRANPAFIALASGLFAASAEKPPETGRLSVWLAGFVGSGQFDRIDMIDAAGSVRLTVPANAGPVSAFLPPRALQAIGADRIVFQDFYLDERDGLPYLAVLVPLKLPAPTGEALGALVLRIDPRQYLFPYLQSWPVASGTAETLLARSEGETVLFLNPLRFQPDAALRLRVSAERTTLPAVLAAAGKRGVVDGSDYRDVRVVAAMTAVADSPWLLVAKIDRSEAFEPLIERTWLLIVTIAWLFGGVVFGIDLTLRGMSRNFRESQTALARRLHRTGAYLERLIDCADTPIIFWDQRFRIIRFNGAFERLTGLAAVDVLGGPLDPLFPADQVQRSLRLIRSKSPKENWDRIEIDIRDRAGAVRSIVWSAVAVFDADGATPIATVAHGQDVSGLRVAENQMRDQVAELRRWQGIMLGREARVRELKDEVNEALARSGQEPRYAGEPELE